MLDVVLLVACVLVALAAVLYVFFWNKLFALILSFFVRLVCWTRSGIWIEFGSVHLSLLAGRILLKNVRYHSSNQTFRIVKCQFSWRYWIRTVAEEEDFVEAESSEKGGNKPRECRIHVSVEGFEWFMYNKTAATDAILEHLVSSDPEARRLGAAKSRESTFVDMNRPSLEEELVPGGRLVQEAQMPKFLQRTIAWFRQQMPDLDVKNLLPISFDATKGAILLGNHTTENLLLAQFASASGTYGIVQSRSKMDQYKQSLRVSFHDPLLSFVENNDHWGSMTEIGVNVHDCIAKENARYPKGSVLSLSFHNFTKLWHHSRLRFPFFNNRHHRYAHPEKDAKKKRKGRMEEESHVGADFSRLEYGVERNLLEAPQLDLIYYADVAGVVPDGAQRYEAEGLENMDIGNGGSPPEWGIELVTYSATIHYGPWADRQRVQLQRVFFPPTFQNHTPTEDLRPGDQRASTCLKFFVEFREITTLHVPFREASKDWQWDGKVEYPRNSKLRDPASIQIRAGDSSTLKYLVPMVATVDGYSAELDLNLDDVLVSSSLNDMVIIDVESYKLSSRLPSPLHWDEERTWDFGMVLNDTSGYIIRDQINMFTDLGKDWSSGPPSDFNTFVPMIYGLSVSFQGGFDINLFANDHNVIDRPSDKQDNTLFTLKGESLQAVVQIPSNRFRPLDNVVSFQVEAPDMTADLSLPKWNTHTFCPPEQLSEIVRLSSLLVNASFRYHSDVKPELVDELTLEIKCETPRVKLLGWVVRHFMVLRENYFGNFTQYSITREYLAKLASAAPAGDPLEMKYRAGKNNAFQVQLSFHVSDCVMCIPAGLPGFESCAKPEDDQPEDFGPGSSTLLFVPELLVQLRSNDVGMEMSLNCDPITLSCVNLHSDNDVFQATDHSVKSSRQLCVSGLEITANRLFGPPPRNLTYACIWEIHVGEIKGRLSATDGFLLFRSFQSLIRGFNDHFNAPGLDFTATDDRDVTFLRVKLIRADISWCTDQASLRLLLSKGLRFDFNGLAGLYYRSVTSVQAPDISIQCLLFVSSTKRWLETGGITCSLSMDWYKRPIGWKTDAEKQKKFLEVQDYTTGRISEFRNQDPGSAPGWHNMFCLHSLFLPFGSEPSMISNGPVPTARRRSNKQVRQRSSSNSDSNEAHLVDFDWDAHLANQKPSGFSSNPHDILEDPNTSLDESDETDASMSDDSWTDYFDLDEETELKVDGTAFRPAYYRTFCRQYALQGRDRTREFESTYVLTRDPEPIDLDDEPNIAEGDLHLIHRVLPLLPDEDSDNGRHSLRVKAGPDTVIFVTPLLVPAVAYLQETISQMSLSLELVVDGLTLDATNSPSASCYDVEFIAPLIRTVVVQDLMSTDAFSALTLSPSAQSTDLPSRVASMMHLRMEQTNVLLQKNPRHIGVSDGEGTCGRISVGRCKFLLAAALSSPTLKRRSLGDLDVKSQVTIEGLQAGINDGKIEYRIERMATHLNHLAPGSMVATALELSKAGNVLVTFIRRGKENDRMLLRRKLHTILVFDGSRPSADILSAIQPSFFVQAGRPKDLRQDLNWKLLFHLRRALASTSREEREELERHTSLSISVSEMVEKLESQRVPWVTDTEGPAVLEMPLFRSLFDPEDLGGRSENARRRSPGLQLSLLLRVTLLEFSYEDSETSILNTVAVSGIDLQFDCVSRGVLIPLNMTAQQESAERTDAVYSLVNIVAWLGAHSVQVVIYPTFILFLRNTIHAWKTLSLKPRSPSSTEEPKSDSLDKLFKNRVIDTHLRLSLHEVLFEAAAENLIFEVASKDFSSSTLLQVSRPNHADENAFDISGNHTFAFEDTSLKARARPGADPKYNRDDTLAAIALSQASFCAIIQKHTSRGTDVQSSHRMKKIDLNVPRSAIRLYHFFEQWRQDYFLGIESMLNSLFSEIRSRPSHEKPEVPRPRPLPTSIAFHASVSEIAINLRVMHGTWLSWSAGDIVTVIKGVSNQAKNLECGLQVASQTVKISSSTSTIDEGKGVPKPTIELRLPSLRTTGTYSSSHIDLIVQVGTFDVTIKPSHWDSLLSVQQKFGQDFNDLLVLVSDTRRRRTISGSRKGSSMVRRTPFNLTARSEGFKIGLEGVSSTQYLECIDVDAVVSDAGVRRWRLTLKNAALYLSPKSSEYKPNGMYPLRVNVDFEASSNQSTSESKETMELSVTRFHVVLQPNSISEVSDFIDHLQAEVLLRQEQRAMELEEFKLKAKKVMQTFNTKPRAYPPSSSQTVLTGRTVKVSMTNFGVAFPLEFTQTHEGKNADSPPTKAFLIAIDSLEFHTHEGERGQFVMKGFSFQFVPRFHPSVESDFLACQHQTLNMLVYPEMRARVHSDSTSRSRKVSVVAEINGFILDIDPSITGYVFSLVDIYRQGRERVERLAAGLPKSVTDAELQSSPEQAPVQLPSERKVSSNILASLNFRSGTVRMHQCVTSINTQSPSASASDGGSGGAEVFKLPELTLWSQYSTVIQQEDTPGHDMSPSTSNLLIFKATVHSSHNVLKPSLLPFVTEVVQSIENRMKKVSTLSVPHSPAIHKSSSSKAEGWAYLQQSSSRTLEMIFSLQIDQSRLELNCKPDANVVAGLHWNNGGFIVSVSPGKEGVSISGTIGGLTTSLKHGFLSDDCANLDARNLNFSINFSKSVSSSRTWINAVSVVVDTEFSGNIRFSRLQDFLVFKAVWLDRIPVFSGEGEDSPVSLSKSSTSSSLSATKQGFDTAILIHVRSIALEADLGQSICTVTLDLKAARARARLTESFSEISVSVDEVDIAARGNLSGYLRMPDFAFRTVQRRIRRSSKASQLELNNMLELNLTTGTLDAQLQSDWLWLLQYRAEPLEAVVYDDWALIDAESKENRQLRFFFSVNGTKVLAMMTIMAIPKLVMYAGKFMANLEAQREGASRESSAFRSTRLPKPDNALSQVANAMFQAARSRLKESETLSYVIGQHMALKLEELVFVVLPRSQGDHEIARFIGINVMAQLDRTVRPDGRQAHRDLRLSLTHMSISQLVMHGFDPRRQTQDFETLTSSARRTAIGNVIFSLPAMDMRMITDDEIQNGLQILSYDFDSKFIRSEGHKDIDNINISFNLSLYSWLTVLRKTLTRELRRAQETAEFRNRVEPNRNTPASPPSNSTEPNTSRAADQRTYSPPERASSPTRGRSQSSERLPHSSPKTTNLPRSQTQMSIVDTGLTSAWADSGAGKQTKEEISSGKAADIAIALDATPKKTGDISYNVRSRQIERLTVRQLGEATPDVMHPFFMKKAGFNLEESLPQFVHEYATLPIEQIMKVLLKLYSKQLRSGAS